MAIKDFTATLASPAYRSWFAALSPNVIKEGTTALRKRYENNAKANNFLITDEKIRDMIAYVTDSTNVSDAEIQAAKQRMLASVERVKNDGVRPVIKDRGIRDTKIGNEIVIENVNFQTIESLLESGFGKGKITNWKRSVGSGFHRGHVFGLPTVLLSKNIEELESAAGGGLNIPDIEIDGVIRSGKELKTFLISILKAYRDELKNQDIASSNMGTAGVDYEIYADYEKSSETFLIEMQIRKVNTTSGTAAGRTFGELKEFLNPGIMNEGYFNKIKNDLVQPSVILSILNSPGSPSFIQLVGNAIAQAIDPITNPKKKQKYSIPLVPIATKSVKLKRSVEDQALHKKEIAKIDKLIAELNRADQKAKSIRRIKTTTNLVQLQNLLNAGIIEQVKRNMGTGNRRDVLNLRTGRFAESIKIERLSESRQGMITAFYSYMKNPYATFSAGGQQDSPKTRDPKLLIAKSIREIAAEQVRNRLRSVNV